MSTLPHPAGTGRASSSVSSSDVLDPRTDYGLRHMLRAVGRSGSWDQPAGRRLLVEIRRRAARNAAHVAATTGAAIERGLVDDVLLAAWLVLRRHGDKVLAAASPWAYLMSSAQKQVLDEVRAQQLLTNPASIRGRAREALPSAVRPVGSTATDLAAALRHEPSDTDAGDAQRTVRQIRQHEQPPLVAGSEPGATPPLGEREPWFTAFIDLLVAHGADQAVTVAAVDRLADLFTATYLGWWEWAARRDPILARLGLSPDQCGALVALVAGSRKYRHNGKHDSLLAAVRSASKRGHPVELSPAHRRRLALFTGGTRQPRPQVGAGDPLATAGCEPCVLKRRHSCSARLWTRSSNQHGSRSPVATRGDIRVVHQLSFERHKRDNRSINKSLQRSEKITVGTRRPKKDRFVRIDGAQRRARPGSGRAGPPARRPEGYATQHRPEVIAGRQ
jgi:hypothetical protein